MTTHEGDPHTASHQHAEVDHGSQHEQHQEHEHAGHVDHVGQFRRLFWIMLVVAVPVLGFSQMFADLVGYQLPDWRGLGTPLAQAGNDAAYRSGHHRGVHLLARF